MKSVFAACGPLESKLLPLQPSRIGRDGVFEGYASLFRIPDLGKDVVEPGAFRDSLLRRGPAGIKLLWQHDPAEPIGRNVRHERLTRGEPLDPVGVDVEADHVQAGFGGPGYLLACRAPEIDLHAGDR